MLQPLDRIERYLDQAPRVLADGHDVGPFTVFVSRGPWPYYARPRLESSAPVDEGQVRAVCAWMTERNLPVALEWTETATPSLGPAAAAAGLTVHRYPMLVLGRPALAAPTEGVSVRVLAADDEELTSVRAAIDVGFHRGGTARGDAGTRERDRVSAEVAAAVATQRELVAAGHLVLVGAFDDVAGAVGGGSHSPRGGVTELTGIATLPAFRRRGVGAQVAAALIAEARERGIGTIFLSASDEDVARVYSGVGFERAGFSCAAELPG